MSDLIQQAMRFAKERHQRIDHRRKYSNQPYVVHLEKVAKIVATVTDDEEMIAASWLHDVVEDTPATLDDIESEFGRSIAQLVRELTDVSKPDDGNREVRKAIDRAHLAKASGRSQTIKLADLIDNCSDISKHDPCFARVYLNEMKALLEVLTRADEGLMRRAQKAMLNDMTHILQMQAESHGGDSPHAPEGFALPFKKQYNEIFQAQDIADSLLSFDAMMPASEVREVLCRRGRALATIRMEGEVTGYVVEKRLGVQGCCGNYILAFDSGQIVAGDSGFAAVIHVLTRHSFCFLSLLGQVQAVISRADVNKPYMRMWLFGIITLTEMNITELLKDYFREGGWEQALPESRLQAAQDLQRERRKIGQDVELIDCLQLADKGTVAMHVPEIMARTHFKSKRTAKQVLKQFQSLRNNLAHGQDISTYDWAQIARLAKRMVE